MQAAHVGNFSSVPPEDRTSIESEYITFAQETADVADRKTDSERVNIRKRRVRS